MEAMFQKWLIGFVCFTAYHPADVSAREVPVKKSTPPPSCEKSAQPMRLSVRHIEGGGIGYNQGYTTLEGFFAPSTNWSSYLPFLDLRFHVFDNGKIAANGGVGLRTTWGNRAYGLNLYYDYRDTNRFHYNQAAFGLETLGTRWDMRINGYFPFGQQEAILAHPSFMRFLAII